MAALALNCMDTGFRAALVPGAQGRVHSVYRRCVNLILGGAPLSIVHPTVGRAPNSALLTDAAPAFPELGLRPGQGVAWDGRALRFPVLSVTGRGAEPFDCTFPTAVPCPPPLRTGTALRRLAGAVSAPAGGLSHGGCAEEIDRRLRSQTYALLRILRRRGDPAPAVGTLVGLGFGLTPSGDDILTGLLLTLRYFKGGEDAFAALAPAVLDRLDATTDVSRWTLAAAAAGRGREAVRRLLDRVADGGELGGALDAVLSIGSTSGRDLCTGVWAGILYLTSDS